MRYWLYDTVAKHWIYDSDKLEDVQKEQLAFSEPDDYDRYTIITEQD